MNLFEGQFLVWIQEHVRVGALNGVVSLITHLGDMGLFWIVAAVLLIVFKKTRRIGILCAGSIVLTFLIVNCFLKPLIARVRPYDMEQFANVLKILVPAEHDFSFPSGHSSNSFACAWVLFRKDRKRFGIPALILAILIALSRLYVGVHYPTDVLAGIVIGIVCSEISIRVLGKYLRKKRKAKRGRKRARA